MKKTLKGFTLIELIVVMFIITILMAGIMQMFKPIRETFVDSTLYETRRTSQSGIIQYVSESLRYATDLGIYNENNIDDAVEEFAKNYCRENGSVTEADVKKAAEVIIIDNTANAYEFNGHDHMGRLLRRKNVNSSSLNETLGDGVRIALGPAYYGDNDYAIKLAKPDETAADYPELSGDDLTKELADWSADEGIRITVASTARYSTKTLQENALNDADGVFGDDIVKTEGLVVCPNLARLGGLFDVEKDPPAGGGGGGGSPIPGGGHGNGNSSNQDAEQVNGVWSDDTVGDYNPGGGGGGGGTPPYVDNAEYDSDAASAPNTKVYIVFLTTNSAV